LSNVELARARMSGSATRGPALAVVTTIALGPHSHERTVGVMDLSEVRKLFGESVDGILGMDVLMDCGAVALDFGAQELKCGA
jgi:hypothetical protein